MATGWHERCTLGDYGNFIDDQTERRHAAGSVRKRVNSIGAARRRMEEGPKHGLHTDLTTLYLPQHMPGKCAAPRPQ